MRLHCEIIIVRTHSLVSAITFPKSWYLFSSKTISVPTLSSLSISLNATKRFCMLSLLRGEMKRRESCNSHFIKEKWYCSSLYFLADCGSSTAILIAFIETYLDATWEQSEEGVALTIRKSLLVDTAEVPTSSYRGSQSTNYEKKFLLSSARRITKCDRVCFKRSCSWAKH